MDQEGSRAQESERQHVEPTMDGTTIMASHALRYFSSPEFLKTVSRNNLFYLLKPFAEFLRDQGVALPETADGFAPDYDRLATVFAAADGGIPFRLAEALFLIDSLATTDGMDKLLVALPDLDPPWFEFTPADIAVSAWLHDRKTVERSFAELQVRSRSRAFVSFQSHERPLPAWRVTDELTAALQCEIDLTFRHRGRGDGTRVVPTGRANETWFLIRHGEPLRREGCIENGQSSSVFFRPERYDAVVVDHQRGELRISAGSRWQKELYRRVFGRQLFGSEEYFPSDEKYTLEPLIVDGDASLACFDVPGIKVMKLVSLEYETPGPRSVGTTHGSDDLFAALAEGRWSLPAGATLTRARFQVWLTGSRTPRSVTIAPPNVAKYTLDGDGMYVEELLHKRGFVVAPGSNAGENGYAADAFLADIRTPGGAGSSAERMEDVCGLRVFRSDHPAADDGRVGSLLSPHQSPRSTRLPSAVSSGPVPR